MFNTNARPCLLDRSPRRSPDDPKALSGAERRTLITQMHPSADQQRPPGAAATSEGLVARPAGIGRTIRPTIPKRTKAATVGPTVQTAFTGGGAPPVPKVKASTAHARTAVVKTREWPHVSAASSVANHADGNDA